MSSSRSSSCLLIFVLIVLAVGDQDPARVRARRDLPPRPADRPEGPGLILLIPIIDRMVRIDLRTVTLDGAAAGGDHQGQRHRARQRGRLLPGHRPEQGDHRGRELPARHVPDRADDAALGARQGRARRPALRARAAQRRAAADHRRADRALGSQGQHGRGQGRRAARRHAAGDRPPGRGRARAARQDHLRRRRVPGRRRSSPRPPTSSASTRRPSSSATCRRCSTSASTRTRRSSSRCRST